MALVQMNAMHQFDSCDRGCGVSETLETDYHIRSRLDVSMVLFNHIVRYFEDRTLMSSGSRPSAFISRTARCNAG